MQRKNILIFFCPSFVLPPLKFVLFNNFLFSKISGLLKKIMWQYFDENIHHFVLFFSASLQNLIFLSMNIKKILGKPV